MKQLTKLGVVAITCASGFVQAGEPPVGKPQTTVNESAVKMYVDPESGRLVSRPANATQAAALDGQFQQDFSKVQEIHKTDGSIEWVFNGQVDSALVAKRDANGKLQIVCSEHGQVHDHLNAPLAKGKRDDR
jgi:hypothetical protein